MKRLKHFLSYCITIIHFVLTKEHIKWWFKSDMILFIPVAAEFSHYRGCTQAMEHNRNQNGEGCDCP